MRTKKLTTKKFLFTEGPYVITHIDPELFIIKAVSDRITAINHVNYSKRGKDYWWSYCGNGQRGWTNAIWDIARELHARAEYYARIQARQHNLFGDPEDKSTAEAIEAVKRHLEEEE